jgi:7-cyano-7-deazaguanine synthase
MTQRDEAALVLFSGGQDSTTCLAWALQHFLRVETVGFAYGQRHLAEIDARPRILAEIRNGLPQWGRRLGADHVLLLDVFSTIGGSALVGGVEAANFDNLPPTFVPGRNIFFLTAAAALAYRRGIRDLVGGMCETDYSGYPDCRDETIKATARALDLGMETKFTIHTPLMHIDKRATWALAESFGGRKFVDLIIEHTVTCYEGNRTMRHAWGYGCGVCAACALRARGYERYIAP